VKSLALALALVSAPVSAQDVGPAVAVQSATLRPADAPALEVGPGIYLPDVRAREIARELEQHRSEPAQPVASQSESALVWAVIGWVVAVFVGGFAVGFVTAQAR